MPESSAPGPEAKVTLREVTAETVGAVCRLSRTLPEHQHGFVADNAFSIAQAHFSDVAWFRAIYADETPVGFIMLSDEAEDETYFLWRFMIGGAHQKKGFGRQAIDRLVEYVKTRPGAKALLVSYVPKEGGPEGFYLKYGFEPNGETYGSEIGATLTL